MPQPMDALRPTNTHEAIRAAGFGNMYKADFSNTQAAQRRSYPHVVQMVLGRYHTFKSNGTIADVGAAAASVLNEPNHELAVGSILALCISRTNEQLQAGWNTLDPLGQSWVANFFASQYEEDNQFLPATLNRMEAAGLVERAQKDSAFTQCWDILTGLCRLKTNRPTRSDSSTATRSGFSTGRTGAGRGIRPSRTGF